MKILLTIEEYKQRAIDLIKETAKQTIAETASDYLKYEIISMLTKSCFTYRVMCVDTVNQLFIKLFLTDRNGNPITNETLKKLNSEEVDEFNKQEWYVKLVEKQRKNYERVSVLYPCDDPENYTDDDYWEMLYELENVLPEPFDSYEQYVITEQVFKELYGYEFHIKK
jgi:hypothetical protein